MEWTDTISLENDMEELFEEKSIDSEELDENVNIIQMSEEFWKSYYGLESLFGFENYLDPNKVSEEGFLDAAKAFLVNILHMIPYLVAVRRIADLILNFEEAIKDVNRPYIYFRRANTSLVEKIVDEIFKDKANTDRYNIIGVYLNGNVGEAIEGMKVSYKKVEALFKSFKSRVSSGNISEIISDIKECSKELETITSEYNEDVKNTEKGKHKHKNTIVEILKWPDTYMYQINSINGLMRTNIFKKGLENAIKLDSKYDGDKNANEAVKGLIKLVKDYLALYKRVQKDIERTTDLVKEIYQHVDSQYKRRASIFAGLGINHHVDKSED